jgi:ABC-type antimicrobial peptide transport system permease subunit
MIKHYLKVAFRNLWKYRGQTLISVIGLAIGFVCFAMAALWIRYEMTYDSFHKNADRMYCVYQPFDFDQVSGVFRQHSCLLAGYLEARYPEIAHATAIVPSYKGYSSVEIDGVEYPADVIGVDSSFFRMFDVKLVEGSMDFILPGQKQIAVTREKALQLFGNETPVGKRLKRYGDEYTVCAVVTKFPKHSNYPFDFLMSGGRADWKSIDSHVIVELFPGTDEKTFREKLYADTVQAHVQISNLTVKPLTSVHYTDSNTLRKVKFQHIVVFSVAGLLLILCTLFNSLMLFAGRFRIRQREFALRTVCGASTGSLFAMLSVEFLISTVIALLAGLLLTDILSPAFIGLSDITMDLSSIYSELLIYIAGIIAVSLLAFLVMLALFRRKDLSVAIRSRNRKLFRKTSIAVQLTVSIVFAFCTIVILKQMYHLHNTDLGFAFKNTGSVTLPNTDNIDALENKIKQIPGITETLKGVYPVLPQMTLSIRQINMWDGKSGSDKGVGINIKDITEQYQKFYEFRLVEGDFLTGSDAPEDVLINEAAAKAFGWNRAAGKSFGDKYRVKGVIKNIYDWTPTVDATPTLYRNAAGNAPSVLFKFDAGTWKSCKAKIEEIARELYPENSSTRAPGISSSEETYDKFLQSENTLLAILTVISTVCVLVCIFGFVSVISLTCEERRREIAIRKINGATVKDILDIFFKEYLSLLVAGALIAFPAGYVVMKRWLESYILQTEMSAWIYMAILLALFMTVVLCVGGQVYRTSRENPIEAIKS